MTTESAGFRNILIATDFSEDSAAALQLAIWLAKQSSGRVVLAHVVDDLRKATMGMSNKAKQDLLAGDGHIYEKEIRYVSDQKLQVLIQQLKGAGIEVGSETLLGEAFVEISHAVQQEGFDLVMTGTRGITGWKQFFVGSTAKKLIRNCPSAVWVVKKEHAAAPKVILVPTDFSDASRKAVLAGLWLAEKADAEFHLLHVIDSKDVPDDLLEHIPLGSSIRQEVNKEAEQRLEEFLKTLGTGVSRIVSHLTWGHPWQEISRIAMKHQADLISIGTVGRSGVKGIVLGNTAERVLDTCDCSILTVKPDDYVSPIAKATWPLHP
jgi:universal stress protein E